MTKKTLLLAMVGTSTLITVLSLGSSALAENAVAARANAASGGNRAVVSEVVVTARRKNENLQDVPIAITALSGSNLVQRGIHDAIALQSAVPSLSVTTVGSRSNLTLSIRGQHNNELEQLSDSPVGVYFDEVNVPRPAGTNEQFYDLQDVQVLKGVQGTLFGRNMTGGALLIESAHPQFGKYAGEATVQIGNYGLRDFFGMVNIPIGDFAALRVDGKRHDRHGFTTDISTGRDYDDSRYGSFRVSLAVKKGNFSNNAVFDYVRENEHGAALKLIAFAFSDPALSGAPPAFAATTIGNQVGLSGLFPISAGMATQNLPSILTQDLALGHYLVDYGNPGVSAAISGAATIPFEHIQNYGFTDKAIFTAGKLSFKNIFGLRRIDYSRQNDLDGSSANLIYSLQSTHSDTISEEFQIQGKFFDRIEVTTGAYYFREKGYEFTSSSQFPQLSSMGYAFNIPPLAQYFLNQPASFFQNVSRADADAVSYAFYGAGSFAITSQLKLSGGLRYNNDLKKATIDGTQPNFAFPTPFGVVHGLCSYHNTPNPFENSLANCAQSRRADFDALTYDATLTYEPTRNLTAYAALRHGYRAGGFNLRSVSDATFAPFKSEYVNEYELGLKNQFDLGDAHLTTAAAAYLQDYTNIQEQNAASINGVIGTVTVNNGHRHDYGAEVEANLLFNNGIGLNLFYAYIDNVALGQTNGSFAQQGAPKHQLGGSFNYGREYDALGHVDLNVNFAYKSSTELDDFDTSAIQPGYAVVNGRLALSNIRGTPISLAVFANNIFNKYYMIGGVYLVSNGSQSTTGGGVGVGSAAFGEPRMFGMELSAKF